MTHLETVAVVITDLVGSTRLASRLGPADAEQLRIEHFALLRDAVAEAGGKEVKTLGDGIMAVFGSASRAVAGAVGVQQRVARRNLGAAEVEIAVRVGISAGDVSVSEDDYFGQAVVEAARLCARAEGGQILASEVVQRLGAGRDGHRFDGVGELELKGLPEPLDTVEVLWDPPGAAPDALPLPARLRELPPTGYVGRSSEREQLDALWAESRSGARRVALIAGEPGIGKTRLATHHAIGAYPGGATILYGRCDEELGVPYGAWIEALRHYVEHAPQTVLSAHVERCGGDLTRLVPELRRRLPAAPPPQAHDPEADRYRLFGAVCDLLAGARDPLILILDDLHWADKPTLALLGHLATSGMPMRALVLGTYRSSDVTRGDSLTQLLADLRRETSVVRLELSGLGKAEVRAMMEAAAGHDLDPAGLDLARELTRETDGNPFFVAEMLRHLIESGDIAKGPGGRWRLSAALAKIGFPESVREVIERRIDRLGGDAARALAVAAVIGREFDVALLARVTEIGEDELLDILDDAREAALVAEAGGGVGRFAFAHALINHTLYHGLGRTRRARLHCRVAEALEDLCDGRLDQRLGELAQHWSAAAVNPRKALDLSRRAGERALAQLAPDEAVRWFGQALELDERHGGDDPRVRSDLLCGLGRAQRQLADQAFRQTLLEAERIAQRAGDGDRLVTAALANSRGMMSAVGSVDDERVPLLRAALDAVAGTDPRRPRLLAQLAMELVYEADLGERRALSERAVAAARSLGDDRTLAETLWRGTLSIVAPDTLAERVAMAHEFLAIAERLGDRTLEFNALAAIHLVATESAEPARAAHVLERATALADAIGQPYLRWMAAWQGAALDLLAGRLGEGEERAADAAAIGAGTGEPDAFMFYGGQLMAARYDQGRLDEVIELVEQSVEENPGISAFAPMLALAHVETGDPRRARRLIDAAAPDLTSIRRDPSWSSTMALWSEVAAKTGATDAARTLYELLTPWRDQLVFNGVCAWGAVAHYLGRLAATLGEEGDAERHLAAAIHIHERIGAPIYLARSRVAAAELLAATNPARAQALAREAAATIAGLGAGAVERHALELAEGAYAPDATLG